MSNGSVLKGLGIGVLMTVGGVMAGVITMTAVIGGVILLGIGLVQLVWIGPAYFHYRRAGEVETAKGLLIAAGLVFLLNASCWGVVMSGMIRIGG